MKRRSPIIAVRTAAPIIEKFGGVKALSELTGFSYHTIDGWYRNGVIPEKYRFGLLALAKQEGVPHTPFDYIVHLVGLPDDVRILA